MLLTTTAVFHSVLPCATSLSSMGLTTTMLCCRALRCTQRVVGPSSAGSANSAHSRSRVQNANGMCHASCRQTMLTPALPAASISCPTRLSTAWGREVSRGERGRGVGWRGMWVCRAGGGVCGVCGDSRELLLTPVLRDFTAPYPGCLRKVAHRPRCRSTP